MSEWDELNDGAVIRCRHKKSGNEFSFQYCINPKSEDAWIGEYHSAGARYHHDCFFDLDVAFGKGFDKVYLQDRFDIVEIECNPMNQRKFRDSDVYKEIRDARIQKVYNIRLVYVLVGVLSEAYLLGQYMR